MAINLTPDLENAILTIAAKIKGSRGGRSRSARKIRAVRRNGKLNTVAKKAA